MEPLAQAYGQFQHDGGVSAADWERWLAGERGASLRHAGKRHLRIVSVCSTPLQPRLEQQQPPPEALEEIELFAELDDDLA
jgi:hypothetical protein